MNGAPIGTSGHTALLSSNFSAGLSSSSSFEEASSLGYRILSEQPEGASCSGLLGSRARRAQQCSSHPIETSDLPKDALQMLGEKALQDVKEFERLWSYLLRSRTDSKCIIAAKNTMNAIECYNRSLRANPEQGITLYQRGLLLLSQGGKEEALKNFKLAQHIGGPYLPDLAAKLEELEVNLEVEQGVL